MGKAVLLAAAFLFAAGGSWAAEKKSMESVDLDAFTVETTKLIGATPDHLGVVWWLPVEFWEATLARDTRVGKAEKAEAIDALSRVSIFAVAQADVSRLGAFDFYSKEEVARYVAVSFKPADGTMQKFQPKEEINPKLDALLRATTPLLEAAMGNMGGNVHFFVFDDRSAGGDRHFDPYNGGIITVGLARRSGDRITVDIALPIDSLFVPRKCPNGKDAHISWSFCPWSGERLAN